MFQSTTKLVTKFNASRPPVGFFLLAADEPVAAKPEKHAQRVQPVALVKLHVNFAPQGLTQKVAQDVAGFNEPPVLLQHVGQVCCRGQACSLLMKSEAVT